MRIVNKKNKEIISPNAEACTTYVQKARGLMFSKQKDLFFQFSKEERVPLHMWFVFYPIDVVYLNKQKKVVEIKEHFKPFTMYFPKEKAQYVLELPAGTVKKSRIAIADVLGFD
jgi:uncharacterized membrane protein (UPF0127 family)